MERNLFSKETTGRFSDSTQTLDEKGMVRGIVWILFGEKRVQLLG